MPDISRRYIKTALGYLVVALLMAPLLSLPAMSAWQPRLWPLWVHLLTVGWLTQLIFGVAYWLFPRHSRQQPYGRAVLAHWAYPLLNAGLLLRMAGEPFLLPGRPVVLVLSALLQLAAGVLMAAYLWTRVKPR